MRKTVVSMALLLGGAGIVIYIWQHPSQTESQPPSAIQSPSIQAVISPVHHYPVPIETDQSELTSNGSGPNPVPSLDDSDETVLKAFRNFFGEEKFNSLFNLKDLVRRIVVSIDNATKNAQPSQELSPLKPLESHFRVTGKGGERSIDSTNFRRYFPYVELVQAVNSRKLVATYVHFYPLFQSAYQDLGTKGYFNDRLIDVIDNILEAPEPKGPIRVILPSVHDTYKYADDRLEALSAAQKIFIRMGNDNARAIKAKLRELRALLVHLTTKDISSNSSTNESFVVALGMPYANSILKGYPDLVIKQKTYGS